MIETTNRQNGETYLTYVKRIIQMVRDSKISYIEMGDALLGTGNVYSSENLRKAYYVLDKMIDKIDGDAVITDNDILIEIEKQKDELYKERVRLRDKKRELNKMLTEQARHENLSEIMTECMRDIPCYNINHPYDNSQPKIEASLLLSDWHYGIKVDNQVNTYNTDIAVERISEITTKAIEYCRLHKVTKLNVIVIGDIVSGQIHSSVRVQQEEDAITQIINSGELLATVIREFCNEINEVDVYFTWGNHGRTQENKSSNITSENVERLVCKYVELKLPNIKVISSETDDFIVADIAGRDVLITHGHNDNVNNVVKHFTNVLKYKVDEVYLGHYHTFNITNDNDTEIITNGSLVGTDDYALSLRLNNQPSQVLRIYGKDCCTYNITTD